MYLIGGLSLMFLLVRAYLRRRLQSAQEKTVIEQKIATLHLHALRSQLNPHFIFNCLTSIQHLQLKGEDEAVLDYLADFSKLIRMTFENSTHDQVSLAQELSFLNTYIALEQKRFEDQVHVEVTVEDDISIHQVLIPSMLLQPLIENAFQHGLLHKQGAKRLKISFQTHDDPGIIHCTIQDNGVGVAAAQQLVGNWQDAQRRSALSITQERMHVLNQKLNTQSQFRLQIDDLTTADGSNSGTLVTIHLPFWIHD